jgi:hypothetical protein
LLAFTAGHRGRYGFLLDRCHCAAHVEILLENSILLDLVTGSVTGLGLVVFGHRCGVKPARRMVEGGGLGLLCHLVESTDWNKEWG